MSLSPSPLESSLNLTPFDDQISTIPSQFQLPLQFQIPPQPSQFQPSSQFQASYSNNGIFPTHWAPNFNVNQHSQQQRIEALEEMVTRLRIENAAIEAACATIEKSYNSLVAQLNRSTTSNNASAAINIILQTSAGEASSFLKSEALPKLKASDYPHIHFWMEKRWNEWRESDAGQASSSNHSFLEDAKGQLLSETRVANILSNMRDLWHEFRKRKLIDVSMTWKSVPLGAKKTFRSEIINLFPELNLCEDTWKVDKLAKRHYASYKQTWFTNKSDNKVISGSKRKMKIEPDTNDTANGTDNDMVEPTAKRFKTGDTTSKSSTRSYTDDDGQCSTLATSDLSVVQPVTATNSSSSFSSSPSLPVSPPPVAINASSSSLASSPPSLPAVLPSATFDSSPSSSGSPSSPVILPWPSSTFNSSSALSSSSSSSPVLPPPAAINSSSSSESSGLSSSSALPPADSTIFPSTVDIDSRAIRQAADVNPQLVVHVKNLLSSMDRELPAMKNINQTTPKQSNMIISSETLAPHKERPTAPPEPSAKSNQATGPQVGVVTNTQANKPQDATATPAMTEMTTGGAQSTTTKKGANWRPPSAKTGRNLCAHRWLRQILSGGTREEFATYYDFLSAELKARYKDEAAKLVSDGVWTNGTAEVVGKVAALAMHTA